MSIYSVNILSVCLSVKLQKALLLMDVFILVFCRLGIGPSREEEERDTEEEVNDYLARAIDARSIDRLRSQHCNRFLLSFRVKEIEVGWTILTRLLGILQSR